MNNQMFMGYFEKCLLKVCKDAKMRISISQIYFSSVDLNSGHDFHFGL